MNHDFSHEVELMTDYSFDESDGDLKILFKHDFYSSDNELGKKLLNDLINNLSVEADRICLIIVVDSAVRLLEASSSFRNLIELSPSTVICSDSLSFYNIDIDLNLNTISYLDSESVISTILNTSPNIIVE